MPTPPQPQPAEKIQDNPYGERPVVDALIIGAGMAGASLGAALSKDMEVVVVEQEDQPGYHTTGRSAAIFTETYGNAPIRALTAASRAHFQEPPAGFSDTALWHDTDIFLVGTKGQSALVKDLFDQVNGHAQGAEIVDGSVYEDTIPIVRPGYVDIAIRDRGAKSIDVGAVHQGYLSALRKHGGMLATRSPVQGLKHDGNCWIVSTPQRQWRARTIVNAAGAWADQIAELAGIACLGLQPLRRTVCLVEPPEGPAIESWPLTIDVEENFYFKPESGQLLCSPADETPSLPCDAQAEDIDVAIAIDRVETVLDFQVRRVTSKWAGLRTFSPDRTPVVGFEPTATGFFWLAGQGGYGIQTAPAIAACAAALIMGEAFPHGVAERGVTTVDLAPDRFRA